MKTIKITKKVGEIFEGYKDDGWDGVVGFGEKLDIRPKYQREFIYDISDAQKVMNTVLNGRPLNFMYWVKVGENNYELLDGQQRTLSVCRFLDHKYYILDKDGNKVYEDTMLPEERQRILDYELDICICEGTEGEILDWFKTINIKGKSLNDQEALNATHTGAWLTDAKRYFSNPSNPAGKNVGERYINTELERQGYLEVALNWISDGDAQGYMAMHRRDQNAEELWDYYNSVIDWVKKVFTSYRSEMRGVDWGKLYREYSANAYNSDEIEVMVSSLYSNEEVENKKGVFEFVLKLNKTVADEKLLSKRQFSETDKATRYEQQNHKCAICEEDFELTSMHGDHILPWSKGGRTNLDNLQMLCATCNIRKSAQVL